MKLKDKIKSYSFWVSLASAIILILKVLGARFGFTVDEGMISDLFTALCSILVLLGIIVIPQNPQSSKTIDSTPSNNSKINTTETNDETSKICDELKFSSEEPSGRLDLENNESSQLKHLEESQTNNLNTSNQKLDNCVFETLEQNTELSKTDNQQLINNVDVQKSKEVVVLENSKETENNNCQLVKNDNEFLDDTNFDKKTNSEFAAEINLDYEHIPENVKEYITKLENQIKNLYE